MRPTDFDCNMNEVLLDQTVKRIFERSKKGNDFQRTIKKLRSSCQQLPGS
jgi:hypothetical protein